MAKQTVDKNFDKNPHNERITHANNVNEDDVQKDRYSNALSRVRKSLRKHFLRRSLKETKAPKWTDNKRMVQSEKNQSRKQDAYAENEVESFGYRGNAKDVARRFANIGKHKVQETYAAAKFILKRKSRNSTEIEETFDECYKDYNFSFSDCDDAFCSVGQ